MSKTQPARGMRDFLPKDVRRRDFVIGVIKAVYESYGFEPLETPSVENLETLTGKYGEEGNQLIFKILKRGEALDLSKGEKGLADLALRYDLTVPLARVVANYRNELPKFFKRYQIQPVWRADRPARGRFREFFQCDVDAIGSRSMIVEAELISAVSEILLRLGADDKKRNFDDFVILVNHRGLLDGLLEAFEVAPEKRSDVFVAIDKLDKIGLEGVHREIVEREALDSGSAEELLRLICSNVGNPRSNEDQRSKADLQDEENSEWLAQLEARFESTASGMKGLGEIRQILDLVKSTKAAGRVRFQPSLARGLSYYTGAIVEIGLNRTKPDGTLEFAGSIGGGGRYDGLIGMFGKEQIPACGFSLGLERILVVMDERGMFPESLNTSSADVLVTVWSEETAAESIELAADIRSAGLRVFVYPEADKLGKQFKYAGQIGARYVCVIGESEFAEGSVTLKNMESGEQATVKRDEMLAEADRFFRSTDRPANS